MSIKKIAEAVGASPATVSRVLNNPDYRCADPGLRDRIWKAAMEMNYSPNEAARNLKKGVARDTPLYYVNVLMTRMEEGHEDPFFRELLHVVESEVHRRACILSKVWYMPIFSDDRRCRGAALDKAIASMAEGTDGRRDGLVIIGKCNQEALGRLQSHYKSVVAVNRNSTNYAVDEVICDGKKIAGMAVEYLIGLGHRDIGYVGDCFHEARYEGYLETLLRNGIEPDPAHVVEARQTESDGYEVMQRILDSGNGPTGIYCANDIMAVGMLQCLARSKNRLYVPSIISSDGIEDAQFTSPMLTTVSLPRDEMGKFAVYLLLDRIQGGHKGVVRMELEGRLVVRESCREHREVPLEGEAQP